MSPRVLVLFTAVLFTLTALSREAPADDAALLIAPRELHAGGRSALTMTTFDAASREPIDRSIRIELLEGATSVSSLFEGSTGAAGRLHVPFDVPDVASGTYTIRARVTGAAAPLDISTVVSRAPAILIETDKPIYRPSQTILGRVLLVDNGLRPAAGEVELSVHDGKGIRIRRESLVAGEYGAAPFSLDLASDVNFGVWKIRARSGNVEAVRDVRVEEYTLPRFEVTLSLPRSWTLVDEPIAGNLEARYFFGRPVEGTARITAKRWVGTLEEYAVVVETLAAGRTDFTLPPVGFVAGTPAQSGQGTAVIEIDVTDSTGHTQSRADPVTVVEAPVVLSLVPRVRSVKPEIPFDVLLTAESPDGEPLDLTAVLATTFFGRFGETLLRSSESIDVSGGSAEMRFAPPAETTYVELKASVEVSGHRAATESRLGAAYSSGHGFLSISRLGLDTPADVGAVVSFSVISTHPGTVFYEVYSGGRTVFSAASESDSFSFVVAPDMIPKARVVAYKINPDNEVAADSLTIAVNAASTITIAADFGAPEARPGESLELTIDAGTGHRTLVGLSVVDASVLALGRGRLHLEEVFGELERRFLEPQVEVHEGDGGPLPDGVFGFFGPPRNYGSRDTLREAGLDVAATANLSIPAGGVLDWAVRDDVDGPPAPAGGGDVGGPGEVRVRQYFPETWVWEPLLLTDEAGRATLSLTAPDSITAWKLTAVGTSSAGIGFGEAELTVFQEFFVEPSLPVAATRGEELPLKVDVFNYLESEQEVALTLGDSGWYELLGEAERMITVPGSSAMSIAFPIRPTELGDHSVELAAIGGMASDAVRRTLSVVPEGLPVEEVSNSVIEAGDTAVIDVSLPPDIVPESGRAFLHVTPSPVAQTMQGVSDLLGMPYGCGEQNMIFLAPDIEVLKYLREIGELAPEVRAAAEYFINVGYQRQLTFQADDGGFSAFGGEDGSLWLTAFVVSTFAGAREVRDVDEEVLARAAAMLVSRRRLDGSFQTDDFLIHKEMDGAIENIYAMTAYVTNALADYTSGGSAGAAVEETLAAAAGYLAEMSSVVGDDPYSLSIGTVALRRVAGFEAPADAMLTRLLELASEEGVGLHWEPYPVETTGYAAMALLAAGRPEASAAVDWLSTQRNSLGGYGASTQDTVVAIRALFLAARQARRDLVLDLALTSGSVLFWSVHVDETNFDVLHSFELPSPQLGGPLELAASGSGSVGFQVVRRYNVPGENLPPPRNMTIEVEYDTHGIEVDDLLDVTVRLLYTGIKDATAMVIADVGVPTGFEVVGPSLEAVVAARVASRYEIAGRKVIFYFDSLRRNDPLELRFQMRALYPVRAAGPVSLAYEYYDADVVAYQQMGEVIVTEPPAAVLFVRGDTNADGRLDVTDPVGALNYLFLGGRPFPCLDAIDTNDDGELDLTDPVQTLNYLFLGGPPPAAPYPDCGLDTTPGGPGCESFPAC